MHHLLIITLLCILNLAASNSFFFFFYFWVFGMKIVWYIFTIIESLPSEKLLVSFLFRLDVKGFHMSVSLTEPHFTCSKASFLVLSD